MDFLELLKKQVLVLDGAMGTMTQVLDLSDRDYGGGDFRMLGDLLTFSRLKEIEQIHVDYFRAGANMVETNTFGASPMRLSEYRFADADLSAFAPIPYGLDIQSGSYEELAYALSKRGAEVACAAKKRYAKEAGYDGRPLFVAGSIGPSNRVLSKTDADLQESTFDAIGENFGCQVSGLIDGGADVILFETQQDILELKAAVMGALKAMEEKQKRLPIMAQVSVDQFSRMQIFHTDIHAALVTVADIGVDVFGINCSIGPDLMEKTVEKLFRFSPLPISVIPNAGLPVSEDGRTVYNFSPERFANHQYEFVTKFGVNVVGGCCGTSPDHIRALAERVSGLVPTQREPDTAVYLSGPQEAVALNSNESLIMIGERLNVRGSLKVRKAVETDGDIDYDALAEVVEEQIGALGLSVIDVCMDSNLVDTTATLKRVVHSQTADFVGAMSLDSFDVEALREAIKVYPGRPIVNSMSLEEVAPGVTKIDAVCEATKAHGPVYVGLCAGAKGPAAIRDDKCRLAKQIVENAAKHGVTPDRILIDMNVFPLGSEPDPSLNFAVESLEAIPLIKAIHPALKTVCGVGNLTNGLAKKPYMRKVLTSVWLDEARKRGLDAAIVNPNHYVFVDDLEERHYRLALDAILRRDMEAFEELERIAVEKTGAAVEKRMSYDDLPVEEAIVRKVVDGYKDRVSGRIEVDGHEYAYADTIVLQAIEVVKKREPLKFVNDYLMPGMQELGDGFARGDVSLPHLLKSADVMKQVMGFIEEFLRVRSGVDIHDEIKYKGVIVLGTVYQDVHSIGKDLAKTLFENYGYRVIDLGVMTPLQGYIDAAKEHGADAIGMSALLVQTSNHMMTVSKMMLEQDMHDTHLLIGGAPVSDRHAAYVAMAGRDNEEAMRRNVFYCPTAMDGVNVMNELALPERVHEMLDRNSKKLRSRLKRAQRKTEEDVRLLETLPRRAISMESRPALQDPWVKPERIDVPLLDFRPHIDKRNLFSLNWKFGGVSKRKAQGISDEHLEDLFLEWTAKASREGWLRPQGVFGVFPCRSHGDDVVVYDIDDLERELCRFSFNVVIGSDREDTVCAAQYFYPVEAGEFDAIGIQISSTGPQIDGQLAKYKEEANSESALFLQGLSDRLAEDMTEHMHDTIRARLGFEGQKIGTRWSPGYPAIANTEHNKDIAALLGAQEKIGISVTDAGEFHPTGCTGALVSFHPGARYS